MKAGPLFLSLILAWNTVDDLFMASFAQVLGQTAPISEDDMCYGSLLKRAELFHCIAIPPTLTSLAPHPLPPPCACKEDPVAILSAHRAGTGLLYLLMSLQR